MLVGDNKFNFWLAPQEKAGAEQGFTLDLGSAQNAVGVRLKNTHNRQWRDRGTKRFRLLGSSRSSSGPWQTILEAKLKDSRQQKSPPVQKLLFENPLLVRFVKFELLEFWGDGGGLQHFSVLTEGDAGDCFTWESTHKWSYQISDVLQNLSSRCKTAQERWRLRTLIIQIYHPGVRQPKKGGDYAH